MIKLIPKFKKGYSAFGKAFADARNAGQKYFDYNGKKYHTRYANETEDEWNKKFSEGSKENKTNEPNFGTTEKDFALIGKLAYEYAPHSLLGTDYSIYLENPDSFKEYFENDWRTSRNTQRRMYEDEKLEKKDMLNTITAYKTAKLANLKFRENLKKINHNLNNTLLSDVARSRLLADVKGNEELKFDPNGISIYNELFKTQDEFDQYKELVNRLRTLYNSNSIDDTNLVHDYVNNVYGTNWNNEQAYLFIRDFANNNFLDYKSLLDKYGNDRIKIYDQIYNNYYLPKIKN